MIRYATRALMMFCMAAGARGEVPVAAAPGAPGIAWFQGDVAEAFKLAQTEKKPVFLYWGAKWCPPCQQLKATVFSRKDFIAKSREFIDVYLDGDAQGSQKWGDKFGASGYPTVVILRPDQKEITRISGGMDLSVYAGLLDAALNDLRPMDDVIAAMRSGTAESSDDCRRLAYYGWDLRDFSQVERKSLARGLARAVTPCGGAKSLEGARIAIASAVFAPTASNVTQVIAIVENPSIAARAADSLENLGSPFYKAVYARGPEVREVFMHAWSGTMEGVAADPAVTDADQLSALGTRLALLKEFAADNKVPAAIAAAARIRTNATLAKKFDPYVRAGVVNAASDVYEQLGDLDAQYALVSGELSTSHTPYYYMIDLGEIEESRHHTTQALAWYERAYRESEGIATRFQWGAQYLSALLRLAPQDHVRIRDAGMAVIGELDGPDRIQARTRYGLGKLDAKLKKWNSAHHYDADIHALRSRISATCAKLPPSDSGRGSCRKFLS
ncbi:MAG TPA: thioredoxin family protein [Steroidobacteraceae bacterium]